MDPVSARRLSGADWSGMTYVCMNLEWPIDQPHNENTWERFAQSETMRSAPDRWDRLQLRSCFGTARQTVKCPATLHVFSRLEMRLFEDSQQVDSINSSRYLVIIKWSSTHCVFHQPSFCCYQSLQLSSFSSSSTVAGPPWLSTFWPPTATHPRHSLSRLADIMESIRTKEIGHPRGGMRAKIGLSRRTSCTASSRCIHRRPTSLSSIGTSLTRNCPIICVRVCRNICVSTCVLGGFMM